jgi:hypothetical protein
VRELCVAHMRVNREQFAPFISDDGEEGASDYDSYLEELAKVGFDCCCFRLRLRFELC